MIRIQGHSDDVVVIEGDGANGQRFCEELGAYERHRTITVGDPAVGGVRIVAEYDPKHAGLDTTCWRLSVELVEEDKPIPWPVRIETAENLYSPAMVIDCPAGTPIDWDGKPKTCPTCGHAEGGHDDE